MTEPVTHHAELRVVQRHPLAPGIGDDRIADLQGARHRKVERGLLDLVELVQPGTLLLGLEVAERIGLPRDHDDRAAEAACVGRDLLESIRVLGRREFLLLRSEENGERGEDLVVSERAVLRLPRHHCRDDRGIQRRRCRLGDEHARLLHRIEVPFGPGEHGSRCQDAVGLEGELDLLVDVGEAARVVGFPEELLVLGESRHRALTEHAFGIGHRGRTAEDDGREGLQGLLVLLALLLREQGAQFFLGLHDAARELVDLVPVGLVVVFTHDVHIVHDVRSGLGGHEPANTLDRTFGAGTDGTATGQGQVIGANDERDVGLAQLQGFGRAVLAGQVLHRHKLHIGQLHAVGIEDDPQPVHVGPIRLEGHALAAPVFHGLDAGHHVDDVTAGRPGQEGCDPGLHPRVGPSFGHLIDHAELATQIRRLPRKVVTHLRLEVVLQDQGDVQPEPPPDGVGRGDLRVTVGVDLGVVRAERDHGHLGGAVRLHVAHRRSDLAGEGFQHLLGHGEVGEQERREQHQHQSEQGPVAHGGNLRVEPFSTRNP